MVTVGLVGSAEKHKTAIADLMHQLHGFTIIRPDEGDEDLESFQQIAVGDSGEKAALVLPLERICDFVTINWQQNHVICFPDNIVVSESLIESQLIRRPFLVFVRLITRADDSASLLFNDRGVLKDVALTIAIQTPDNLPDMVSVHLSPDALQRRARPPWDDYFMSLARLAERRSNCMKRRVGALLVHSNRILSTGYNGTPRGLPNCRDGGCRRCNEGVAKCGEALEECRCLHAEENAIVEAGGVKSIAGAVIYCTTMPCLGCAKKIVQVGVKRVVWEREYYAVTNSTGGSGGASSKSIQLLEEAGIQCDRVFEAPGIIVC